jgi:nicotinate-nucleotide adenylyltransferase
MRVQPVGILGGTFDPVHHGHLRLALEIAERVELDSVRLIPLHAPPHRPAPIATPAQRLAMLELAVQEESRLRIDTRELRRGALSYTVDTLTELRAELGTTPLCLIVGMDAFLGLPTWRRWEALIDLAHIVVADRPAADATIPSQVAQLLARHRADAAEALAGTPAGLVHFVPCPKLDISATAIRAALTAGRNPRYLLPDPVLAYIHQHELYRQ